MDTFPDTTQLLKHCREGDSCAIELLIRAYKPLVYKLALSILDDPAEADEATQDSFVAVLSRLDSYRGQSSFKTWLYAITLNTCRGRLRKRQARERLVRVVTALFRVEIETAAHPEQIVLRNERDKSLWQAVAALDHKQREVIVLRYYHELAIDEIAAIVGVSGRTIRTRMHLAHERIRAWLQGKGDGL